MQKKALTILNKLSYTEPCGEYFRTNGIITFPCNFIHQTIVYIHKNQDKFHEHGNMHGHDPNCKSRKFINLSRHNLTKTKQSSSIIQQTTKWLQSSIKSVKTKIEKVSTVRMLLYGSWVFKGEARITLVSYYFFYCLLLGAFEVQFDDGTRINFNVLWTFFKM